MRLAMACVAVLLLGTEAPGYRPFVSTDAAVADRGEVEVELGYVGFRRGGARTTLVMPTVVGNLGLGRDLEAVAEFKLLSDVAHGDEGTRFEDTAMSIKWVAYEGALHRHGRFPSLGVELSLVVPTRAGEHRPGGELVGIASGVAGGWTYHLNGGVLVEPGADTSAPVWGVIFEHQVVGALRAVAEVNGESATGTGPDDSALLGAVWEVPTFHGLALDLGVRHGITRTADEWAGTAGFTVAFPLWDGGAP